MYREVGPLPAFAFGWLLALVLGGAAAVWLLRRARFRPWQIAVLLAGLIASLFAGSKVLYLLESLKELQSGTLPVDRAIFSAQMRIPGGFMLAVAVGPLIARVARTRFLTVADAVVPAAGVCIVGIRVGCFLDGCCYGLPSSVPWALAFPRASGPYWWQVQQGYIANAAATSLPIHPLQLYFAAAGLAIFAVSAAYRRRKRYDGEILLLFLLAYLWSTWGLEHLRAVPHDFTRQVVLVAAMSVTCVAIAVEWRRVRAAPATHRWSLRRS